MLDKPPREEEERAKSLAVTAVAVKEVLFITLPIPPELYLIGAKLQALTQAKAYKLIREMTLVPARRVTAS